MPTNMPGLISGLHPINQSAATDFLNEISQLSEVVAVIDPAAPDWEVPECPWCLNYETALNGSALAVKYAGMEVALVVHLCVDQPPSYHDRCHIIDIPRFSVV